MPLIFLIPFSGVAGETHSISGKVLEAGTDSILANAEILLLKDRHIQYKTTFSSAEGNFRLRAEAGTYNLVVLSSEHKAFNIQLKLISDTVLLLRLEPLQYELREAVISGKRIGDPVKAPQMGMEKMAGKEVEKIPSILGEPDVIKALQTLPGVQGGGEGSSGFFVRGGSHDQNLFLLDNVHLYQVNHLLGLLSVFNADIVDNVTLYKGDFPAQYGGRLSSVMAVETRDGNRDSVVASAAVGLIASKLTVEGPLKKGQSNFLISGRRTYADLVTRSINWFSRNKESYQPLPNYNFHDLNGKFSFNLNDKNILQFNGYYGDDYLYLRTEEGLDYFNKWGNTMISLAWKSEISKNTSSRVDVFNTRYRYSIESNTDGYISLLKSNISDLGVKVGFFNTTFSNHKISFGGELIDHHFFPQEVEVEISGLNVHSITGSDHRSQSAAVYINDQWKALRWLELSGGLRLSAYSYGSTRYLNPEPRLSTSMRLHQKVYYKMAYARMNQYSHLISNSRTSFPTDIWYPATDVIPFQRSDQVSAGFHIKLGSQWLLTEEVYYKWMNGVVEYAPGADILFQPDLAGQMVTGTGWSYGNEFLLKKSRGRLTGCLAYTLSWAKRQFVEKNLGRTFFANYDRRHVINLTGSYELNERTEIGINWEFASGNPGTLPVGRYSLFGRNRPYGAMSTYIITYTDINNIRLPAFHHLDLSLNRKFSERSSLLISIYNVYYRRNPFYLLMKAQRDDNNQITGFRAEKVSLLPLIPSITYKRKF
ncbi:MAG: TonB-dependent receptor [Bacteroidia bacterium]